MRIETALLEFKEERQSYFSRADPVAGSAGEASPRTLYTTMTMQGVVMLWPVRLPDESGRLDPWNTSAHDAAKR